MNSAAASPPLSAVTRTAVCSVSGHTSRARGDSRIHGTSTASASASPAPTKMTAVLTVELFGSLRSAPPSPTSANAVPTPPTRAAIARGSSSAVVSKPAGSMGSL